MNNRKSAKNKQPSIKHNNIKHNNLIKGPNAILEALKSNIKIEGIIVGQNSNNKSSQTVIKLAKEKNIKVRVLSKQQIWQIAGKNSQNIIAFIKDYQYYSLESLQKKSSEKETSEIILALDSITDPHNLGAIIRSSAAFGVKNIIITKHKSAEVTPGVWKASAGQVAKCKIIKVSSLANAIKYLKTQNFYILSLDGKGKTNITDKNIKNKLANEKILLVLGSEGKGISRLVLEKSDFIAKIPINKNVESLNVSVAAGITLFELLRPEL
ncbi:MAG: 23S rRNA (guanosine(2251)-2'-O)-methyltransferase RlmB [Bifidobacteriaceae bacterium]|jgi:23S rRNA (guanosine2251-2'-O)-methyltransferase|nr:23S rRNA (guanosine(2251)-2'-O)-methyltransferase RlmB [Bifidobacteriaceae bacterium]